MKIEGEIKFEIFFWTFFSFEVFIFGHFVRIFFNTFFYSLQIYSKVCFMH